MQLGHIKVHPNPFPGLTVIGVSAQETLKWQQTKILNQLKEYQIDVRLIKIISQFFELQDERKGKLQPPYHMVAYMKALTSELSDLLIENNPRQIEIRLFQVLIRFNFNKESIYKYYRNRLDTLLEENSGKEQEILLRWEIESQTPVRADMAYSAKSNTLSKDILAEIKKRRRYFLDKNSVIQPLQFTHHAGVYVAILRFFIEAKLIKTPVKHKLMYETIHMITRGPENKQYEPGSIKNRFALDSFKNVKAAKKALLEVTDLIDYYEKHGEMKKAF